MTLLPSSAVCEKCNLPYSSICRTDEDKVYVAEHVENCNGRQNSKDAIPVSKTEGTLEEFGNRALCLPPTK